MTVAEYVNWVALPPPVTTGTALQSYVDPTGETWVAKNGVFGGAWRRASQYLKARAYRGTTIATAATGWNQIPFDAIQIDPYGIISLNAVPAVPSIPLTGWWDMRGAMQGTPAQVNRVVATIWRNGAETVRGSDCNCTSTAGVPSSVVADIVLCGAGDTISFECFNSVIWTMNGGIGQTYFSIAWRSP